MIFKVDECTSCNEDIKATRTEKNDVVCKKCGHRYIAAESGETLYHWEGRPPLENPYKIDLNSILPGDVVYEVYYGEGVPPAMEVITIEQVHGDSLISATSSIHGFVRSGLHLIEYGAMTKKGAVDGVLIRLQNLLRHYEDRIAVYRAIGFDNDAEIWEERHKGWAALKNDIESKRAELEGEENG